MGRINSKAEEILYNQGLEPQYQKIQECVDYFREKMGITQEIFARLGPSTFGCMGNSRLFMLFDQKFAELPKDQLEGVIAHEVAHFKLGHIDKRNAYNSSVQGYFSAVLSATGYLANAFFLGFAMNSAMEYASSSPISAYHELGLSRFMSKAQAFMCSGIYGIASRAFYGMTANAMIRKQEYEADHCATEYTNADQKQGLVDYLANHRDHTKLGRITEYFEMFVDHPAPTKRIDAILATSTAS